MHPSYLYLADTSNSASMTTNDSTETRSSLFGGPGPAVTESNNLDLARNAVSSKRPCWSFGVISAGLDDVTKFNFNHYDMVEQVDDLSHGVDHLRGNRNHENLENNTVSDSSRFVRDLIDYSNQSEMLDMETDNLFDPACILDGSYLHNNNSEDHCAPLTEGEFFSPTKLMLSTNPSDCPDDQRSTTRVEAPIPQILEDQEVMIPTDYCPREEDEGNDDEDELFVRESHNYQLRPGFRDTGATFNTWLDRDTSGNYDPCIKSQRRRWNLNRPSRSVTAAGLDNTLAASKIRQRNRRVQTLLNAAVRVNSQSYIHTITLCSDRGKSLLASGTDNWPADTWNTLHNDNLDFHNTHRYELSGDEDDDDVFDPSLYQRYRLRDRKFAQTPITERPDLGGQPAARGCWNCYSLGMLDNEAIFHKSDIQTCSSVHDGTNWPCRTCAEDNTACELITAPKVKKSCEECKRRKKVCSYSRSSGHEAPCLECQETGHHCVAGPHKAFTHRRISLDSPLTHAKHPRANEITCTECLRKKSHCTLGTSLEDDIARACQRCEKRGLTCLIANDINSQNHPPVPALKRKRQTPQQGLIGAGGKRRQQRHLSEFNSRPSLSIPAITTKLCHPIVFNYGEDVQCNFHMIPQYPVLGRGVRRPTVTSIPHSVITEVKGDQKADSQEPTLICRKCTSKLMRVMVCRPHNMVRTDEGRQPTGSDFADAFNRLVSGTPQMTDSWCSVCPSLAQYECRGSQMSLRPFEGCGLRLCQLCYGQLTQHHQGMLSKLLDALPVDETHERPFGLRADAELLRDNGELAKFMSTLCGGSSN